MQFDSTPGGCPNMFGPHNDWHNRFAHPRCGSKNAPFYGLYNVGYNFQWSTFLFANLRRRDDATEFGSGPLEKTKVTRLQSSGCNVTVGDINGCVCVFCMNLWCREQRNHEVVAVSGSCQRSRKGVGDIAHMQPQKCFAMFWTRWILCFIPLDSWLFFHHSCFRDLRPWWTEAEVDSKTYFSQRCWCMLMPARFLFCLF